jgi:Mce-associated membrane protein
LAGSAVTTDRAVTEPDGDEGASDPAPSRRSRFGTTPLWIAAVAVVIVITLAVLAFLQTLSLRHHDDLGKQRSAAIEAASTEVATLLTVKKATSTTVLKKLLDGATADFHDQLQQQAKVFQQAITQGKVTSTGSIAAAGLVSMTGSKATVALAAKATVRNASSPKGDARNYRLTVTVQQIHGRWLVAGLKFVV